MYPVKANHYTGCSKFYDFQTGLQFVRRNCYRISTPRLNIFKIQAAVIMFSRPLPFCMDIEFFSKYAAILSLLVVSGIRTAYCCDVVFGLDCKNQFSWINMKPLTKYMNTKPRTEKAMYK